MSYSDDLRQCLVDLDVVKIRRLWAHVFPQLPQPKSDKDAIISMHMARTTSKSVPFKHRAYSHRWLTERSLPSTLPDNLRPRAERMYPRIVEGVGVSIGTTSSYLRPLIPHVQAAVQSAILDAYAEGKTEPAFVKARIIEAKDAAFKQLLGVPYTPGISRRFEHGRGNRSTSKRPSGGNPST